MVVNRWINNIKKYLAYFCIRKAKHFLPCKRFIWKARVTGRVKNEAFRVISKGSSTTSNIRPRNRTFKKVIRVSNYCPGLEIAEFPLPFPSSKHIRGSHTIADTRPPYYMLPIFYFHL